MTKKATFEEPIFANNFVTCYSDRLVIYLYYFPYGSKTVQYKDIQSCKLLHLKDLGIFKRKTWGMALSPIWWHLDLLRFSREYCIILDVNQWPQIGLTMDDSDTNTVYHLIQRKIDENQSRKTVPENIHTNNGNGYMSEKELEYQKSLEDNENKIFESAVLLKKN